MNTPIIAIDGPAASGKGTLARKVAETLSFAHMDTGALYRAVAFEILQTGGDPVEEKAALAAAALLKTKIATSSPDNVLHNTKLREEEVAEVASQIAAIPALRAVLVDLQRDFAQNPPSPYKGAVLDGRDIGTVICPDAAVKLFITASLEVRADRRLKELQSKGISATSEAVLRDMRARDHRDAERQTAPMKPAADAIVLDTSEMSPADALAKALDIIGKKLEEI